MFDDTKFLEYLTTRPTVDWISWCYRAVFGNWVSFLIVGSREIPTCTGSFRNTTPVRAWVAKWEAQIVRLTSTRKIHYARRFLWQTSMGTGYRVLHGASQLVRFVKVMFWMSPLWIPCIYVWWNLVLFVSEVLSFCFFPISYRNYCFHLHRAHYMSPVENKGKIRLRIVVNSSKIRPIRMIWLHFWTVCLEHVVWLE